LSGGTIRVMQGVVAQKRAITAPAHLRTGLPAHIDIAASSAAMALDVLALSHETESMNEDCLRVGIWNYVVPSLLLLRDDESANFIQIVVYLMQKNSSLMMRGMDVCILHSAHSAPLHAFAPITESHTSLSLSLCVCVHSSCCICWVTIVLGKSRAQPRRASNRLHGTATNVLACSPTLSLLCSKPINARSSLWLLATL
jgi:hypothetical protein